MHTNRNTTNPFYVLLVGVGILFVVTACAYGVMTVRQIEPAADEAEIGTPHDLLEFMDRHGSTALMVELAALAVLTVAAIGTDSWWTQRGGETPPRPPQSERNRDGSVAQDRHTDSTAAFAPEPGETAP